MQSFASSQSPDVNTGPDEIRAAGELVIAAEHELQTIRVGAFEGRWCT